MSAELPIACSLGAAELPARLAEMRAVGRAALVGVERSATRAVLRFRPDPRTRGRLAAIVAAEAECCAFLDMTLREGRDDVALTIDAPPDAAPILGDLVAAFAPDGDSVWDSRPPRLSGPRPVPGRGLEKPRRPALRGRARPRV